MSRFGILLMAALILSPGCGVQFQTARLYDGVEQRHKAPRPSSISKVVEPIIFQDDASNFWVAELPDCVQGEAVSGVSKSGQKALKISWNRDPLKCVWAGFGIGWDNWAGKDLSEVYDYAAIEFYVRTQKGRAFALPVVLTLEDYSGRMAWSYISNKYFERYYLDENWQRVQVPLNTFDLNEDGIDLFNVKQLMFELQQSGAIYVDDILLVEYEPQPTEIWRPEDVAPAHPDFPVQLFDDDFINNHGWGLYSDACQRISLSSDKPSLGQKAIHALWDTAIEDCYTVSMGVNWKRWFAINLSDVQKRLVLTFDVRTAKGSLTDLPISVGVEDYERRLSLTRVSASFIQGGLVGTEWTQVRVPFSELSGDADWSSIKQLLFRMHDAGDLYLDNWRLVLE
jgi:hypothetical protein